MARRSRLVYIACTLTLATGLVACGGSDDPGADQGGTDCGSLTATLDEANLAVDLSADLSTHADSEEGATVSAAEADEIQTLERDQVAAQDAVDAAGC